MDSGRFTNNPTIFTQVTQDNSFTDLTAFLDRWTAPNPPKNYHLIYKYSVMCLEGGKERDNWIPVHRARARND